MADQLICFAWTVEETEKKCTASSAALTDAEKKAILEAVTLPTERSSLPEDEENETLACVYCFELPTGRIALARTGLYYSPGNNTPKGILHAFIDQQNEDFSPLLYVINNCFKNALTVKEEETLQKNATLSTVSFPHAQFRLSQQEINKYFSAGRRRTLANLIQSIIDSYDNQRIVILNDRFPTLKYWFFGLHCCLPRCIRSKLTLCSYAYEKRKEFKLICGAPEVDLDVRSDIEKGSFVIDNRDGISCDDIEAVKYALTTVNVFLKNAEDTEPILTGVEELMHSYQLPVSSAAGIYYLLKHDFDWFDSAHEIKYFLNKIGAVNPKQVQTVAASLWREIKQPDFKFGCNESLLPVIAYIFKHTEVDTKEDIRAYIDYHRNEMGINDALSIHEYYKEIRDKLSFLCEYLPTHLIVTEGIPPFLEKNRSNIDEVNVLMYMIIDDYDRLVTSLGQFRIYASCRQIMLWLLKTEPTAFLDICRKAVCLPSDFSEQVIVASVIQAYREQSVYLENSFAPSHAHREDTIALVKPPLLLKDSFVFSILIEIAGKTQAAAHLLSLYACPGGYSDTTLDEYMRVWNTVPEEAAKLDAELEKDPSFHGFLNDMAKRKFLSAHHTTHQELERFFTVIFLVDGDREYIFENKLHGYIETLLPVRQIEEAGYFLALLSRSVPHFSATSLAKCLYPFLVNQSPSDIYDFYINNRDDYCHICVLLKQIHPELSQAFLASGIGFELKTWAQTGDPASYQAILSLVRNFASFSQVLFSDSYAEEWNQRFFRYLGAFLAKVSGREADASDICYRVFAPIVHLSLTATQIRLLLFDENTLKKEELLTFLAVLFVSLSRLNQTNSAWERCLREYLAAIPFKDRPAAFSVMISCRLTRQEREALMCYLAGFYYSTLSFWQKFRAVRLEKLFSAAPLS